MDSTFEDTFNKVGFENVTSVSRQWHLVTHSGQYRWWTISFLNLWKKIESELVEMEKRVKASEKAVIQSLVDQIKNVTIQLPRNYVQGS